MNVEQTYKKKFNTINEQSYLNAKQNRNEAQPHTY